MGPYPVSNRRPLRDTCLLVEVEPGERVLVLKIVNNAVPTYRLPACLSLDSNTHLPDPPG